MSPPFEPMALSLTLLIHAERMRQQGGSFEFATYTVLDRAIDLAGWSEERRADLYARIVEGMGSEDHTKFITIQRVVTACLKEHCASWRN